MAAEKCLCIYCRLGYRAYRKKGISTSDYLIGMLLALFFTASLGYWNPFVFSFLVFVFLLLGESFLRVRFRMSVVCPHCGFDPILYKKNPAKANEAVRDFLEHRADNAAFLTRSSPMMKRFSKEDSG